MISLKCPYQRCAGQEIFMSCPVREIFSLLRPHMTREIFGLCETER
jgi:hypothetical protein